MRPECIRIERHTNKVYSDPLYEGGTAIPCLCLVLRPINVCRGSSSWGALLVFRGASSFITIGGSREQADRLRYSC